MNHTYKTLYNTALGAWVAVPETARNHGKTKSVKTAAVAIAVAGALFSPTAAQAASWTWGNNAQAPGADSIAMGDDSNANTKFSVALGTQAQNKTNGDSTIVIGYQAQTMTDVNPNTATNTMGQQVVIGEASVANSQSVALGAQVRATGQASIAIGGDDLGNNDSKTSAGKYTGGESWRNYAGQPITVEGVSTKDAAATGFIRTTSSGRGSIAVGHMGQSTGKASVAIGADSHAEADGAIATGMASQAKGVASVATGIGATAGAKGAIATGLKAAATGTDAIATGTGAKAGARNDVAIGHDAGAVSGAATTGERVMIGANATVGANQNINVAAGGTFGTINLTTKTANQSVAIGGGSGEGAGRRTYAYGDQSLAIGSDTLAYGDGSVAIGGDDLDSAGNQQTTYTDPNSGNQVNGTVRQAYNALTGDTMQSGVYAKTVSKQAAVAVGVQAQAADLGVALGAKSGATKTNSVAIGTGAQATLDNAVAIGGGSKTLEAGTKQESTTINGVTYNWAGGGKTLPGDIVSFGATGYERQLKHVAAGEVSATSTDAINGSQLYAVAAATSYLANGDSPVVRTNAAGEPLKKARDGNYYKAGDVNADGSPKAGAVAQTPVALSLTHHDGTATPTTLHNVAAGSADTDAVNVSQIYNYAHVNDGTATQGAGIATSNRAKVNEKGGATGDYAIAVGVETVAAGNSSTAAGYRASATNAGDIALGHNAIAAGRSTATGTITAGNVTGETYGPAMAQGAFANATGRNAIAIGNNAQAKGDAAGTVNDVIAIGGNSIASGDRAVAVGYKASAGATGQIAIGETTGNTNSQNAVFIGKSAGNGNTSATGNTSGIAIGNGAGTGMTGGTENVAIGANSGTVVNGNTNYAIGSRAGQTVTGSDNYAMGIEAGRQVTGSQNSTFGYHSGTNITGSSNSAFGRDAGKNIVGNQNLAFGAHAGQYVGASGTAVQDNIAIGTNANKFSAGSELTTSGNTAIGKNSTAKGGSSVALGDTATADKANAVALGANSNTNAAATRVTQATVGSITYSGFAGGTNITAGDQVSVGKTDSERQIKHVAPGEISATSTDAINGSQLYWTQDAISNVGKSSKNILGGNAAMDNRGNITMSNIGDTGENTVHDAIKAVKATANKGWNVQTNGSGTTNVAPGDTVNFKNGTNIAITHTGKEITIATNPNLTADSLTINNGGPVINNSGINMGNKGISNLADGNIANGSKEAVNGGQLFQTNQKVDANTANIAKGINFGGTSGANKYHLGDTINVKGDNNITSTTVNGGVQLGLKDTITVGPANGGNPVTINGNAGTMGGLSNKTWNPNNIVSGQAATEDQLKAVADEAAKKGSFTLTAQGANGSTVGDGATVDLNNTDGNISVSKNAANNNVTFNLNKNIKVESVTHVDAAGNTTITNGKGMTTTDTAGNTTVVNSTGVKTTDAAGNTTVTNATGMTTSDAAGNTTVTNATGMTTSDAAGNTTAITGNGMTISKPGKDVVSLTGDGLNNGNNKITHVKAGEADTDAVNVSQLKKAADAAKTKVVEGDGIKVAETKNTDGSSTYKVSADTAPITTVNNKAATAGNNKQLATAQDVVNAVNNSGFTLKSSVNGGEKESGADEVIKPGSTVDMAAGKNMKVKQEANGKITYSTKDEVEFDKVTVGGVVIDKNDGINAGNKKIANVANGTGDNDAVNVSQLKGAADAFGGNAGLNTDGTFRAPSYNLVDGKPADNKPPRTYNNVGDALGALNTAVTSPLTFGGDSGSNFDRKLGSQVYVKGGATGALSDNNIGVVSDGNNTLNVKLAKDVNVQSVTTTDAAGNKTVTDGNGVTITPAGGGNPVSLTNTGLNNGGNKITNVADGVADSDAANVKQVKAARTEVKAGTNIASVDKTQANDGHDIYTVNAKGTTVSGAGDVIVTATNSGDNVTNYQVSLSGGVKQDIGKGVQAYDIVTTQGIRFGGDTGVTNVHKLGDTMMIMGDQNVKTAADVDGIHMRLNPDVNVNSVTTGDTKMNDEGVAIKNGPALTKQGINAGNLPIRNVAPGRIAPDSRDAVNGAQLHALGRYVDNVDKRAKAGTASAIATAGLPQAYRPGASMVAAAGGYYDGQSAVAIGVSTISDNGRWVIKGAANVNSKEAGATIGIGYQW